MTIMQVMSEEVEKARKEVEYEKSVFNELVGKEEIEESIIRLNKAEQKLNNALQAAKLLSV